MLFPDLSEYQSEADIAAIRKQTSAIILRVGYGAYHHDAVIDKFRSAAHANAFEFVGLYHYLVAGQDAAMQASQYTSWVGKLQENEIPILDLEEGIQDQSGRAADWFNVVDPCYGLDQQSLDQRSWLYSYSDFIFNHGLNAIFSSDRHTWLANYSSHEPTSPLHTLWQCTDGKLGSNITYWQGAGYCDTNHFAGTGDQLSAMAWHPAPPPTPPSTGGPSVWNIHTTCLDDAGMTIEWDHSGGVTQWQTHLVGPGFDKTGNVNKPEAVYGGLKSKSTYNFSVTSFVNGHVAGVVGKDTFTTK